MRRNSGLLQGCYGRCGRVRAAYIDSGVVDLGPGTSRFLKLWGSGVVGEEDQGRGFMGEGCDGWGTVVVLGEREERWDLGAKVMSLFSLQVGSFLWLDCASGMF